MDSKQLLTLKRFFSSASEKRYNAGDVIISPGQICKEIIWLKSGFLRNFYLEPNGKDTTIWFASKDEICTLGSSFFKQVESKYGIQAIEDSVGMVITYDEFHEYIRNQQELSEIFQNYMWDTLLLLSERVIEFQTKTAKERYINLIHKHPDIFQKAQLGHIATYLGITLQSLSRIRATK
jgi:CRP-like cAMP-binding protein